MTSDSNSYTVANCPRTDVSFAVSEFPTQRENDPQARWLLYRSGMTRAFLLGFIFLTAACGGKSFESLCVSQVPAPAACNTPCDPSMANTCPASFHCSSNGKCDTLCTQTGNECGDGYSCTPDGYCQKGEGNGCTGLQCNVTDCQAMNMPATTITGTVFAPNGMLPLYGVSVYVPNSDPGPFQPGVQCGSCASGLPGDPIAQTTTDDMGRFTLTDVPSGANIPVVITIGKWRRQIKISNVAACTTQALAPADTSLPKSHDDMTPNTTSVDMPQIAISTGSADSLECLVRRLGIADKEITTDAQSGKIHLFADTMATQGNNSGVGVKSFDAGFGGGTGNFSDAQTLWGNATNAGKLSNYDIVILSCEGAQHAETKPQQAMDHLKTYADLGGRVFLSHWHNIWLEGATQAGNGTKPTVWPGIAQFSNNTSGGPTTDTIDEVNNPKGASFASWMLNVGGSPPGMRDSIPIQNNTGKNTCTSVTPGKGEQWVYWQNGPTRLAQNFQFTTPNEGAPETRCGKVVFSDMHVSGGPVSNNNIIPPYPTSCGAATTLSPQEKALAFMFFDISSCVGVLF